jgi:acetate kinase
LRALLASRDLRTDEAAELFVFRITRETGALARTLGGLDGLVFTARIGEHAAEIRAAIRDRRAWLGVVLDREANACGVGLISAPGSHVDVRVIPTDENAMITQHTLVSVRRHIE